MSLPFTYNLKFPATAIAGLILFSTYYGPTYVLFTLHPLFAIAALLFATLGIISNQQRRLQMDGKKNDDNGKAGTNTGSSGSIDPKSHNYFMLLSAVCTIIAASAIYLNKERNNKPHFTTIHGQGGLVLNIIWIILSLFSVFALWDGSTGVPEVMKKTLRSMGLGVRHLTKVHRVFGTVVYIGFVVMIGNGWWKSHAGSFGTGWGLIGGAVGVGLAGMAVL